MALVALYRPGPLNSGLHTEYAERKHGRRKVTYPHPDLEPILKDTYGVMVYQEQVMQVAVVLAGYSMGEADTLRKAMGKKKLEVLMPFKEKFIAGAVAKGYEQRLAADLFDMIVPFADYGFNASHACAYGLVAYQTAYLMAHHPVEYMAAVLTSREGRQGREALLPLRVPRDGHRGPAARTSTSPSWTSRRRPADGARRSATASRRSQRRGGRRAADHRGPPARRAPSSPSRTSAARSSPACSRNACWSR